MWLAFRGASADNRFHSHAAVQFVAGAAITIADESGRELAGPGWAIRSGVRHCLRPAPALMLVLADAQSHLARGILGELAPEPIAPLPPALVDELTESLHIRDLMVRLQQRLPGADAPIDPRLAAALRHLERQTAGDAVAAASAASGLSASRLRALSRAQFGVPFGKLVLWKKVRLACLAMARGASLVDAGFDAGFADQAHLTRTMADVIGLTPGEARSAAS
ncbi:MAG: helix-turn-helix domain-containing protein [Piscinibacter sp.]|uniref:helix-turn-helix domain-containing protein n=1 Tax=Piscinibacter sp. TaxID=1903157 RepID=UPI00258CE57A|nr:helix-turn-helix domain-containing protein [Piscinibacter sp.]MCW5663716.1 helix-turn-helix domain-containing protein [Piscinibacter sp.]